LKTQNDALLLKNLHKFYHRADCPWVHLIWNNYYNNGSLPDHRPTGSFWWRTILKLLNNFKGLSVATLQQGSSVLMWHDMWDNKVKRIHMPELFSYTHKPEISVEEVL
jgi:hypothetical protein